MSEPNELVERDAPWQAQQAPQWSHGYQYDQRPANPARRWLVAGGLALAFALMLGVGAVFGSSLFSIAQAASLASGSAVNTASSIQPFASGPNATGSGAQGQGPCLSVTVSSVSGQTITGKAQDGSTVTIRTTSSTQYRQNGQTVSASAVTAGSQIRVVGTRNSDGSVTATRIDIS